MAVASAAAVVQFVSLFDPSLPLLCLSLSLFGWLLNKKAARVEANISLAFLY